MNAPVVPHPPSGLHPPGRKVLSPRRQKEDVHGTPLPEGVLESVRRNGGALKGPITTPIGTGFRSANVALRRGLDLYAKRAPGADLCRSEVQV